MSELRQKYPLKELLKLSKLPRSTYYYYRHHKGEGKYKLEKQEILNLFELNKQRYGYRRITALLRQKGIVISSHPSSGRRSGLPGLRYADGSDRRSVCPP